MTKKSFVWFLIISAAFVVVGALLWFFLSPISLPFSVALIGAWIGLWAAVTVGASFYPINKGTSLKVYDWASFETGYYTKDEFDELTAVYAQRPGGPSPEEIAMKEKYCKRSVFARIGFGDWGYFQYPFYKDSEYATTARLRIPIRSVPGLFTRDAVAEYEVPDSNGQMKKVQYRFPSMPLKGNAELILSLGLDFGRVKRKFPQGKFATKEDAEKALKDLEPDILDALQKGVNQFVWVPRGSPFDHPDNILRPKNRKRLEQMIRRELRSEPDNSFVVAGFLQYIPPDMNGDIPLVEKHEDIGPGVTGINIPLEDLDHADPDTAKASNKAAIASAEANARVIKAEGWRKAADAAGIDIDVVVGESIMTETDIGAVFIGDLTPIDLAKRMAGKPK